MPRQPARREQPLNLSQALVLIAAILMLVFSAKSALKASWRCGSPRWWRSAGRAMLTWFIRKQLSAARPMWICAVHPSHNLKRVMMAMTAPITLVGFELLDGPGAAVCAPENAVRGGDIYAAGRGGQRQRPDCRPAGVAACGLREVATGGMLLSAFSFLGLALTDFSTQQWLAWG